MFKDNHFLIIVPAGSGVLFCSCLLGVDCWVVHEVSVIKGDLFVPFVFVIAMERPF